MGKEFIVETSARHVHLTKEDFEVLFGTGKELTPKKDLSQPGQYACEERVEVVGTKKSIPNISILGPYRKASQVELSMTDARSAGIAGVVRESGDTAGTPGCIIKGPAGQIEIKEGVIVAKRHIHLTPADAAELGVSDKEIVWVKLDTDGRSTIFGDVVIRVADSFSRAMHIDTDESNAASCGRDQTGTIIKI
ncbi:MAG: phosphate propanoyltransferase [Ruminococcus sp.]|jgi:putative phosphotransacetylase|nr:phosphate propanoyltransferase [Ruminococcus sp.]